MGRFLRWICLAAAVGTAVLAGGCGGSRITLERAGSGISQPLARGAAPEFECETAREMPAEEETEDCPLAVFVCGAVRKPGVYRFGEDARVCDAVEAAGGFAENADREWTNLAMPLADGIKIRIATLEETALLAAEAEDACDVDEAAEGGASAKDPGSGRINLNTADVSLLMSLPGIGEAKAMAIIAYRSENGAFSSIEEIKQISGIKDSVFLKIRDLIEV